MITHTKSITTIATASFLLIDGGGSGSLSFVGSTPTGLNSPFAKNHHRYSIATCIDQPVTKHIGYSDIFDAHDMSSSSPLVSSVLSKVVDDADNGVCDIAMGNDGLALSMKYHPTSGYVGQDKCTYEMCIVEDDVDAMNAATKECSELTIAIHVEDCPAVAANGEAEKEVEKEVVFGDEKVYPNQIRSPTAMATSSIEHRSIVSVAKKVSSFRNLRSSSNIKKEEGRKLIYSSSKGKSYNEKDLIKDVTKLKGILCQFLEFKFKNSDLYKEEDWLEHICSSPSGKSGKSGNSKSEKSGNDCSSSGKSGKSGGGSSSGKSGKSGGGSGSWGSGSSGKSGKSGRGTSSGSSKSSKCTSLTSQPSSQPSISQQPSEEPSTDPSESPSNVPSNIPSNMPSLQPSFIPSISTEPSSQPSFVPSTSFPTDLNELTFSPTKPTTTTSTTSTSTSTTEASTTSTTASTTSASSTSTTSQATTTTTAQCTLEGEECTGDDICCIFPSGGTSLGCASNLMGCGIGPIPSDDCPITCDEVCCKTGNMGGGEYGCFTTDECDVPVTTSTSATSTSSTAATTSSTTTTNPFPGGTNIPQCDVDNEDCLCGECTAAGVCTQGCDDDDGGTSVKKPDQICIKPSTACSAGSSLTVNYTPSGACSNSSATFSLNDEETLCPGGWFIERPAGCGFYNNLELSSTCVDSGAQVNIHTSCSQGIALCNEYFSSYIITGYALLGGNTWITDDCSSTNSINVSPVPLPATCSSTTTTSTTSFSTTTSTTTSTTSSTSEQPSSQPSVTPTETSSPSLMPSDSPSTSKSPSLEPSDVPSTSIKPSLEPSDVPSQSSIPSLQPSVKPSISKSPSLEPSELPSTSTKPSLKPTPVPVVTTTTSSTAVATTTQQATTTQAQTTTTTAAPECGNGDVETGEECDPPLFPTCSATCQNLCLANQYVLNNACDDCPDFSTNGAGDDPSGGNTACACEANRFVQNNQCVSCTGGETNAAGDQVPGPNTSCVDCSSFTSSSTCDANSQCRWVGGSIRTCIDCIQGGTSCETGTNIQTCDACCSESFTQVMSSRTCDPVSV